MTLDELRQLERERADAGDLAEALRLLAFLVGHLPDDVEARLRVADLCLRAGQLDAARTAYAAVAYLDLQAGRPLRALVAMAQLAHLGEEIDPLRVALAQLYGADSPRTGQGARPSPIAGDTPLPDPGPAPRGEGSLVLPMAQAAARLASDTRTVTGFPKRLPPVPLLSELSSVVLVEVLRAARVRRFLHSEHVLYEGEPGDGFYLLASGSVRVYRQVPDATQPDGVATVELARLFEGAIFGEMALLSAEPRSASVDVVGEADLVFFGREAIAATGAELPAVGAALERFAERRTLQNVAATCPLFAPFSIDERGELLRRFATLHAAAGEVLVERGAEVDRLLLVAAGELEVLGYAASPFDASDDPVLRIGPGQTVGELALLDRAPSRFTVRAARPSLLLAMPVDYFDRLVLTVPEVADWLHSVADSRRAL